MKQNNSKLIVLFCMRLWLYAFKLINKLISDGLWIRVIDAHLVSKQNKKRCFTINNCFNIFFIIKLFKIRKVV